jgi:carbonic anhydrase
MKHHYWENRETITPQKAFEYLKEGNERFINNLKVNRDHLDLVNATAEGQFPFAAILSCSDSRTSAEIVFDQGLGDIFSVRLAGNIASLNAIASLEFSCKVLGSKLIVVLGHTSCGAIKGACDRVELGNIQTLLEQIYPAVDAETAETENRTSKNKYFVENVAKLNVEQQIKQILTQSPILNEMIQQQEIGIVGGMYNVKTGKVEFYSDDIFHHAI